MGKTTLATHIFRYLAFSNAEDWAFYDADPQRDGYSWLSGHSPDALQADNAVMADAETGEATGALVTREMVAALAYPNIIVDAPPRGDFLARLSEHAGVDLVLVPVNGRLALDGAVHVAQEAHGARVVVVFNMTDPKEAFVEAETNAARKIGVEVYPYAIPRNAAVRKGELEGIPAWEVPHAERTHAVKALRGLCEWVRSGAGPLPEPEPTTTKAARTDIWDRYSV